MPIPALTLPVLALVAISSHRTAIQTPVADVPIQLVNGHIYVSGETLGNGTNSRPVSLLIDSGAGMSVSDLEVAKSAGAKEAAPIRASGAGESVLTGAMLRDLTVQLKGTEISAPVRIGIPLKPMARLEGRPIEVILGFDFFSRFAVQIDYQNRRLRLYEPKGFTAPTAATSLPIALVAGHPHIDMEVGLPGQTPIKVRGMVDTGASAGAVLTNRLMNSQALWGKIPAGPTIPTGAGVGGQTTGRRFRGESIRLAGFKIAEPIFTADESKSGATGATAAFDVLLGYEVLKRFTVTFDYANKRMLLEPNSLFTEPFPVDQVGAMISAEGDGLDDFTVYGVIPGSPADEAGIKKGDRVLGIDGRERKALTLESIRELFRVPSERRAITLERDGKKLDVVVKPRPIY